MPAATTTISPPSRAPDAKATKPKRPPNAFLCFRSDFYSKHKEQNKSTTMRDVSKLASQAWRQRTQEETIYWESVAERKKQEHALQNPGYVYQPAPAGEKKRLQAEKKQAREDRRRERDEEKRRGKGQTQQRGATNGNLKASRPEPYPSTSISTPPRLTDAAVGTSLPIIGFNNYTPQSFIESSTYPTYPIPASRPVYVPNIFPMHALPYPIALPSPSVWPPVRRPAPPSLPCNLEFFPAAASSGGMLVEDAIAAPLSRRADEHFIPTEDTRLLSTMDRESESPKDEFSGFDSASDWEGLPFTPFDSSEDDKSTPNDTDTDGPMTPADEMSTALFTEEQIQNPDSEISLENNSPPDLVEETMSLADKATTSSEEMWDLYFNFNE